MRILTTQKLESRHSSFLGSLNASHELLIAETPQDIQTNLSRLTWDLALIPQDELGSEIEPLHGRGVLMALVEDLTENIHLLDRPDIDDVFLESMLDTYGAAKISKYEKLQRDLFGMNIQFDSLIHDFRTPMTIVSTTLELILLQGDKLDPKMLADRHRSIKAHLDRMKVMLANFVDCSRTISLAWNPQEIDALKIAAELISSQQIRFETEKRSLLLVGDPLMASLDRDIYKRLLMNLLEHYMLFAIPKSREHLEILEEGNRLLIRVAYTGGGLLPPELKERIFEPRGEKIPDPKNHIKYNKGFGLSYNARAAKLLGGSFNLIHDSDTDRHALELRIPLG